MAKYRRKPSPANAEAVDQPQAEPIASAGQAVVPFSFGGAPVRAALYEGDVLFVGSDVATALGYARPAEALRDHCKASKKLNHGELLGLEISNPPPFGALMIPERDVYRLIMRSKLPAAEAFEEWVVGTVLPTIRKTGAYVAPGTNMEAIRAALVPIQEQIAKLDQDNALLAEQVRTLTITGDPRLSAVTHISAVDICTKWQIGAAINAAVGPRYAGHPTEERACRRSHAHRRHRRHPSRTRKIPCGATCSTTSAALHRPRHPRPGHMPHHQSRRRRPGRRSRPRSSRCRPCTIDARRRR